MLKLRSLHSRGTPCAHVAATVTCTACDHVRRSRPIDSRSRNCLNTDGRHIRKICPVYSKLLFICVTNLLVTVLCQSVVECQIRTAEYCML